MRFQIISASCFFSSVLLFCACPGRVLSPEIPSDAGLIFDDAGLSQDAGPPLDCAGPSLRGDLVLSNADDIANFQSIECYSGTLTLTGLALESLRFDNLEIAFGEIQISDNPTLRSIEFAGLKSAENIRTSVEGVGNTNLETLRFSALEEVVDLRVLTLPSLVSFEAPLLREIKGSASFIETLSLNTLSLDALERVEQSLSIAMDGGQSFSLPVLASVGANLIISPTPFDDTRTLESFSIPQLSAIGGDFFLSNTTVLERVELDALSRIEGRLQITGNVGLEEALFESLLFVGGDFSIQNCLELTTLDFRTLESVGGNLRIRSNSALAQCIADDVIAGVNVEGESESGDNRAGCNCNDAEPITATCQ